MSSNNKKLWYSVTRFSSGDTITKHVAAREVPRQQLLLEEWNKLSSRTSRSQYHNDFKTFLDAILQLLKKKAKAKSF